MALAKVGRKLKRTGKDAYKFQFTAQCEQLTLQLKPEVKKWAPYKILISFSRGHRKVETSTVFFKSVVESGQEGDATWTPPSELQLLVTLYRAPEAVKFDEKEYKFEMLNISKDGEEKCLAVFYCDMSQYVKEDGSKDVLSMSFKPSSKKVASAALDLTIQSELIKKGKAGDDDMMSTASRLSHGDMRDLDEELGESDRGDVAKSKLSKAENKELKKTLANLADANENDPSAKKSAVADWLGVAPGGSQDVDAMLQADSRFADAVLVDGEGKTVSASKLLGAAVIGVYFSAEWCPPCRAFMPVLRQFYQMLKDKGASFELLWVSSDKNEQAMQRYARSMEMNWPLLEYDHPLGNELRDSFEINSIPTLCIVDTVGNKIDHHGRTAVEKAVSTNTAWSSYNLWLSKVSSSVMLGGGAKPLAEPEGGRTNGTKTQSGQYSDASSTDGHSADVEAPKKGLLQGMKNLVAGKKKTSKVASVEESVDTASGEPEPTQMAKSKSVDMGSPKSPSAKSPATSSSSKEKKGLLDRLKSKDMQLEGLQAEVKSLSGENDRVNEENRALTERVDELQLIVQDLRQQMEVVDAEKAKLRKRIAELNVQLTLKGWLSKRGAVGPTKNVWRRRYFELGEQGVLNYFAENDDSSPRGTIDLNEMTGVQEHTPDSQSDATQACFKVVTKSRTYELMAKDRDAMTKWINALDSYHTSLKKG